MRVHRILLLVGMAVAAGGCETATNVVNCTALAVFASDEVKPQPADVVDVPATAETEPVTNPCDAADDPAIWSDAGDPGDTKIAITNKTGKLAVHGLDGRTLSEIAIGRVNNVDIRSGVALGDRERVVAAATNRSTDTIDVFALDKRSGELTSLLAEPIRPDVEDELYGMCLYHRPADGTLYAFATDKSGGVTQWRLDADGGGRLTGREVRSWQTGVETEGCVVDDANGWLHVGAQNDGIWRYDADPDREVVRTVVDTTGVEVNSGGRLAGDVEGLALYAGPSGDPGDGYLIASSQGNSTFVVYDRAAPQLPVRWARDLGVHAVQAAVFGFPNDFEPLKASLSKSCGESERKSWLATANAFRETLSAPQNGSARPPKAGTDRNIAAGTEPHIPPRSCAPVPLAETARHCQQSSSRWDRSSSAESTRG